MSGYTRINRPQLLSDSNTSTLDGSLSEIIDNPVHTDTGAYLLSRIGDIGNPNRHPMPGYCLKFDSNNPNVYIQTNIPSSEFNNYNIVIKGEGTKELLKVDISETNIKIILRETPTGTDYFNLSYIAFLNKETNSPQHLFECEEGTGNQLYDAVTGDVATIESITDINSLRISSKYKETIRNENNLQCGIKSTTSTNIAIGEESPASSNYALVSPFNLIVPFSVCITLKFSKSREDVWSEDRVILNTANSLNILNTGSAMNRLTLGITNGGSSLYLSIDDNTYAGGGTAGQIGLRWNDDIANSLFDGNWHKLIFIVTNTSNIQTWKLVLDDKIGTYPANTDWMFVYRSSNTPDIFTIICRMNLNIGKHDGISYKDFYIFNFDMSAADAPYTIENYRNEVMPVNISNTVFTLNNVSKEANTWLDNSDSLTYTNIQGEYELENKNYGTWCNNVGYSEYTDFLSPSNFDTNLSLTGGTGWKWGNFRNQYYQLSVINDIDIKISNISSVNTSYESLWWGNYNNTYTQRRIDCKKIIFKIDDLELSDSLISKISGINSAMVDIRFAYITDFSQTTGTDIELTSQTRKYYNDIKNGNTLWEIDIPNEAVAVVGIRIGFYTPNSFMWDSSDYFVYKNPRLYLKDFQDINLKNNYSNYSLNYINIPRKVGK